MEAETTGMTADERHFILRRLHSLTGIVPIGGFLLFHFFENASARNGAEAFNHTVKVIGDLPYLYAMEVLILLVPILFHSIYGLLITAQARPNVINYPYARSWAYLLQRITGVLAFLFIILHVVSTRGWALFVKADTYTFADMASSLSSPAMLAAYILGIAASTYHFTNGLWGFSITWGIVRTQPAMDRLAVVTNCLFFVMCAVGLDIISAFVLPGPALTLVGQYLGSLVGL